MMILLDRQEDPANLILFYYVMRGLRCLRLLRLLRLHRRLNNIADEFHRKLSQMVILMFTMVIFDAGLLQYVEQQEQDLRYHEWIYFLIITISTVYLFQSSILSILPFINYCLII